MKSFQGNLISAVEEQFSDDHPFTKLIPNLQNIDPEDAYSVIPYEKVYYIVYFL